jgi:signal transduction histidine kinase
VKGEALAYELESAAAEVHAVEDVLDQVGRGRSGDWDESVKAVAAAVERARVALEEARALMVRASPLGAAVLDQVSVRRSELDALVALTLGDRAADRDGAVARVVRRLTARPFGEAAGLLAERAAGWAASVGKRVALEVRGGEQPVPADVAARLPGLLAQLVRNAVVHGIELPEVRRALGKDPAGTIVASCASDGEIVVADDGAGLADDDEPRSRPADLLAGRGIGLRAVRSLAMEVGRMLIVESDPGRGARFRLVPTARSLPPPAEGPEERA